jgi:putative tricarboxylic transport membrane protein
MKTKFFMYLFLMSLILSFSVPAFAKYPDQPITLISWGSPGSSSDICARTLAKVSEKFMGQPIVVLDKEGGAGLTAMKYLLSKPADGYTALLVTKSLIPTLYRKGVTIKPTDFDYICRVQYDPNLLSVGPASPVKDFKSFLDYARKNPDKLRISGFQAGGYHNMVMYRIEKMAGIRVKWVPYPGSGEATVAAMGGHVDGTLSNPTSQLGGIESGKLKPIVVTSGRRLEMFPDVPTLKEEGVDIDEDQFRGIVVNKGTPADIISTMMNAIKKGLETGEWKEFIKKVQQPYGYMDGQAFRKFVLTEFPVYKDIVEAMAKSKEKK